MKDLLLGLWASIRLAAEILWDTATAHWNVAPERCRRIFCCIVAVLLILGAISVASAENAPDSNFGLIRTEQGTIFACYLESGVPNLASSDIYTCLVMKVAGPGVYMTRGSVTYCANSGELEGMQAYECGPYEDMRELARGI